MNTPVNCPRCTHSTKPTDPFCIRCGFDIRHGELKRPKAGICWFCESDGPLTDEHVVARWIIAEAKIAQKFEHVVIRPRELGATDNTEFVPGEGRLSSRPTIEGHSAPVVCANCNNGWMSQLQNLAAPTLRRLIHADYSPLTQDERAVVARWVAVAACTSEYYSGIQFVPQYIRSGLRNNGLPAGQWLISMSRPTEEVRNGAIQIGHAHGERSSDVFSDPIILSMWISFGGIAFHCLMSSTIWNLWYAVGSFPDFQEKCCLRNVWPLMTIESQDGIGRHTSDQMNNIQQSILLGDFKPNRQFEPDDIYYII